MIRYILKSHYKDQHSGAEIHNLFTIDGDAERVESELKRGGFSENGYDYAEFIGIEIINK